MANMAHSLMYISGETELGKINSSIIHKIGLDSIPVEIRVVLKLLAEYQYASTKNLAIKVNLTTDTVGAWLAQVNALQMVDRRKDGNNDVWKLRDEYKDILCEYLDIEPKETELEVTKEEELQSAYLDDTVSGGDEVPDIDMVLAEQRLNEEF